MRPTTKQDVPKIEEWIAVDPFHKDEIKHSAEWLLTGNGALAFCVTDAQGPLCYVRLDAEDNMLRLATQFAPENQVSKKRLVTGLLSVGIPAIIEFGKNKGYKGIVFESTSEPLIAFMQQQGFFKAAGENDYALTFEEATHV